MLACPAFRRSPLEFHLRRKCSNASDRKMALHLSDLQASQPFLQTSSSCLLLGGYNVFRRVLTVHPFQPPYSIMLTRKQKHRQAKRNRVG